MGGEVSKLINEERVNWVKPHELVYSPGLREQQLLLLPNFGSQLQLCYQKNSVLSIDYQHWYVTDKRNVIEFGGGEITNARWSPFALDS